MTTQQTDWVGQAHMDLTEAMAYLRLALAALHNAKVETKSHEVHSRVVYSYLAAERALKEHALVAFEIVDDLLALQQAQRLCHDEA